jgi:hypothetical protein
VISVASALRLLLSFAACAFCQFLDRYQVLQDEAKPGDIGPERSAF